MLDTVPLLRIMVYESDMPIPSDKPRLWGYYRQFYIRSIMGDDALSNCLQ
jgi:hypothetical protein